MVAQENCAQPSVIWLLKHCRLGNLSHPWEGLLNANQVRIVEVLELARYRHLCPTAHQQRYAVARMLDRSGVRHHQVLHLWWYAQLSARVPESLFASWMHPRKFPRKISEATRVVGNRGLLRLTARRAAFAAWFSCLMPAVITGRSDRRPFAPADTVGRIKR